MNVAIIGSGGREHAIAYKISESKMLDRLYVIPGNAGTSEIAQNVKLSLENYDGLLKFLIENQIEFVIIGPEKPLVDGLADYLRENGIIVFGPNANAAKLEGNKAFSKDLMQKYGIPTADYKTFSRNELEEAVKYLNSSKFPVVIKADGLAAGKGVLICKSFEEALAGLEDIFVKNVFKSAGDKIVVEEFMDGEEASIFAITDGTKYICLPSAQDHKRIGNNDTGKNTGGMGAYSPAPIVTDEILELVKKTVIEPTIIALKKEDRTFNGCLYCGLMITKEGPKVVEYNCRFGDPETQVVLPLLKGDFLELLYSTARGRLNENSVAYGNGCSICVITASEGYPDEYETGHEININVDVRDKNTVVFHSGTKKEKDKVLSNGGRVLAVTCINDEGNLLEAKEKVYKALEGINYKNIYYRNDIADKGIKKISKV